MSPRRPWGGCGRRPWNARGRATQGWWSEDGQLALAGSDAQLGLVDGHVVDARLAAAHVTEVVELPLLVAVGPPPLPVGVARLVLETDGDAVAGEGPQVLPQAVVELALPLAGQELDHGRPAEDVLAAVAPLGVLRVGPRDALRVAGVPRVLSRLHLLTGCLLREGREGRSWIHRGLLGAQQQSGQTTAQNGGGGTSAA